MSVSELREQIGGCAAHPATLEEALESALLSTLCPTAEAVHQDGATPILTKPSLTPEDSSVSQQGSSMSQDTAATQQDFSTSHDPTASAPPNAAAPQQDPFAPPNAAAPQQDPSAPPNAAAPQKDPSAPPNAAAPQQDPSAFPSSTAIQQDPSISPSTTAPQQDSSPQGTTVQQVLDAITTTQPKQRQKRVSGRKPTLMYYAVTFKGNNSQKWDGKEISIEAEWLEDLYDKNGLFPGRIIELPWGSTNWKVVVTKLPEEDEGGVSSQRMRNKGETGKKRPCKGNEDDLSEEVMVDSPQLKKKREGRKQKPTPKGPKKATGESRKSKKEAGQILRVGRNAEGAAEAVVESSQSSGSGSRIDEMFSHLIRQQDKIVDMLSQLVTQKDHQSSSDSSGQQSSTLPDKSPIGQIPELSVHSEPPLSGCSKPLLSDPPLSGRSEPLLTGHSKPLLSGRSEPPLSGCSKPLLSDPPLSGRSEPLLTGHSKPLLSGRSEPPFSGRSKPLLSDPPLSGRSEPLLTGRSEPPLSSHLQPLCSNLGLQESPSGHSDFNQGLQQDPSSHSGSNRGIQGPSSGFSASYQRFQEPPVSDCSQTPGSNQGFQQPRNPGSNQGFQQPRNPGSNQGFQQPSHSGLSQMPSSLQQPRHSHSLQGFKEPHHSGHSQPHASNQRFQEPHRFLPPEDTLSSSTQEQKKHSSQWSHSSQSSSSALDTSHASAGMSLESLSEDFFWSDEDSDYLTSHSLVDTDNTQWYNASGSESLLSPFSSSRSFSNTSSRESSRAVTPESSKRLPVKIPPPPFSTPPKLRSVEQVMNSYSGTSLAALRRLTTALAREAIFGRDELAKMSLTGRKNTEQLDEQKVNYIKTLVHSRVPNKSSVDFEETWKFCRGSLSKSCQTLRNSKRKCFSDY